MTYVVILSRRAERELEEAAAWWAAHRSRRQAVRWYAKFSDALASLSMNPERFPFSPENDRFSFEIRDLHFGLGARPTHRAVYTIQDELILILAIRHLAQEPLTQDALP